MFYCDSENGRDMAAELTEIEELHKNACILQKDTFVHPSTGFFIMTGDFLKKRGSCCGSKCLFCPFRHENVKNHSCTKGTCSFQYL